MDVCEVYALNIQPCQISKRLLCAIDDEEAIKAERASFLEFLQRNEVRGRTFTSQLDAWNIYDIVTQNSTLFVTLPIPTKDEEEMFWERELEEALLERMLVKIRNYNEFGGQE